MNCESAAFQYKSTIAQQRLQEMARNVQNSRLFSARNFILAENTRFRSSPLLVAAKRCMQLYRDAPKTLRKYYKNDSEIN